jgi:hypothetical protein
MSSNWINSDSTSYTVSLDCNDLTFDTGVGANDIDWIYNNMNINPDQVEQMCKEYPALEKVWRNFKSVYDMCYQDYKGKLKERGLDDDIPF